MSFLRYYHRLKGLPPNAVFEKLWQVANRTSSYQFNRIRDSFIASHSSHLPFSAEGAVLFSYFPSVDSALLLPYSQEIAEISSLYLAHRFDLLGSGWVQVYHGQVCRGLEGVVYPAAPSVKPDLEGKWLEERLNSANIRESQKVWALIDDLHYQPIDWHLDFKSGYRWSEATRYMDVRYAHKPGVDVKVPWELARMQHFPMLVWAFVLSREIDGLAKPEKYVREFRNQVIDFIATNPPRFGVNWRCTMDVAIRVVNWLVAYDLFRSNGAEFDRDFERVFVRAIYEHGQHCIKNLEYNRTLRSNHYLADIAGLLYAAAYLPCSQETDRWFAFAVQEVLSEMEHQFNLDGSNFEASTSYHRLSVEMMLYCALLVVALPEKKRQALSIYDFKQHRYLPELKPADAQEFEPDSPSIYPKWFWNRLEKAIEFTLHITKPTGEIAQIGDNDSGRLLKLWPAYQAMTQTEAVEKYTNLKGYTELPPEVLYWDEKILDHRHLIAAGSAFFQRKDFAQFRQYSPVEVHLIETVLREKNADVPLLSLPNRNQALAYTLDSSEASQFERLGPEVTILETEQDLTQNLQSFAYPDFGLYGWSSEDLFFSVRCGSIGQNGNGGHAHNDQLSVELQYKKQDIFRDPGTYLYTPFPEIRNRYRSTFSHATPMPEDWGEQNEWEWGVQGLFSLKQKTFGSCVFFDKKSGIFCSKNQSANLILSFKIETNKVVGNCDVKQIEINASNGYGKQQLNS